MVACRSCTVVTFSTACFPISSVVPYRVPPLDAATGHPDGEGCFQVIPPIPVNGTGVGSAAKLGSPDEKRLLEKPASLEILHQRRDRLIGHPGVGLMTPFQFGMLVPGPLFWPKRTGQVISTNRTPDSSRRRARRHWRLYNRWFSSDVSKP